MNKIIIGLLAATVAAGGSVLTNPEKKYNTGDWYGHTLSDAYTRFSSPYLLGLCLPLSSSPCAYYETPEGDGHITATFSKAQALEWMQAGYLEPVGAGFYLGL
ncbi:hypothetical protein [Pedobacter hartonius]|uniref:Uncharacterized protein n=1 Tax=Pedobacter hartonius TaxID=425514 RepID=A0A1H4BNQ6_9SPHI|nr:hypothetical protein [Pedobacter hartonius]SEA49727.1 hypothetical protein SAMN05443550_103416 [Pedobacter hartonius]